MATTKAIIDVSINTSDAAAQLRNLQTQINSFNAALNKNNVAQSLASKQLAEQLMAAANATTAFTAEQVRMETAARRLDQTLMKGRATLGQYFSARFKKDSSEAAAVLSLANARAQALETQFIKTAGAANGFRDAIAIRPLQALNDSTLVANQRMAIHSAMLRQATTSMINFGKNTQWAGRQLMVGFTVPLTIFGAAAGKTFKEIEQAAVRFKKVYGDAFTTPDELEKNMKAVEGLALEFTKYGIAVKDTIGLAAEAAAAGAQNAELIAATTEATRLATLGQMENQEALSATIALQNAFKLSAKELATEVNFLNMVENQTVVTLQDLAGAIPRVAPVIVGLGGDVRDMAAMLAAMQEGGVSAAQGANALKSGLGSLINPTEKATEKLKEMGINLNQIVQANRGDLMGTVQAFGKALATLDQFSRQQALEEVFGKYQYARLGALFDNIIKDGTQASRVMQLAGMSAEQMAKGAEKELGFIAEATSTKYMAAMERFKMSIAPIGELFMKISTPIINFFAKLFEMFDKLPDGAKSFSAFAAIIVGVVVPAGTMFLGLLMNLIGTLTKFGHIIGVAIKGLGKGGIGGAVQAVSQAMKYMGIEEIEASNAAKQLGLSTEFANTALLDQVTKARNAQVAIDNLKDAYLRLITVQGQMAQMSGGILAPSATAAGAAAAKAPTPKVRRAFGGTIPGSGNSDTVPAMLTPGEFVVNKGATSKNLPLLQAINNSGKVPGFNGGGLMSVGQYMSAEKEFLAALGGTTAKQSTLLGLGLPTGTRELSQLSEREMAQFNQMVSGALKSRGIESDLITLLGMGIVPGGRDINDLLRRGKLPGHMAAAFFGNPDIWMPMTQTSAGLYLPSAATNFTKTIAPQIASALKTMKNVSDDDVYSVVERVMRESGGSRFYDALQKDPGAVRFGLTTMLSQQLASTNPRGSREVYTPVLSSVGSGVRSVDYKGRSGVFGTFGDLGPLVFGPGLTSDVPGRESYQRQYNFPGQQKIHIARGIRPQMFNAGGFVKLFRSGLSFMGGVRKAGQRSTRKVSEYGALPYAGMERKNPMAPGGRGAFWASSQLPPELASIGTTRERNGRRLVVGHVYSRQFRERFGDPGTTGSTSRMSGLEIGNLLSYQGKRLRDDNKYDILSNQYMMFDDDFNTSLAMGNATSKMWKGANPEDMISLIHMLVSRGVSKSDAMQIARIASITVNRRVSSASGKITESMFGEIVTGSTIQALKSRRGQKILSQYSTYNVPSFGMGGMIPGGKVTSSRKFYGKFNAKTVELFTKWISSQPYAITEMKSNVGKDAQLAQMFRGGFRKSRGAETLERATWLTKASLPQPGETMSLGALASFSPKGRGVLQHLADSKLRKDAENADYWLQVDQRQQKHDSANLRKIMEVGPENWPSWAPERRYFNPSTRETGINAYIEDTSNWLQARKISIKERKRQIREYKQMIPTIIELETPKGTIRANLDDIVELQNQQFMGRSTSEQERILHNALIEVLDVSEEAQNVRRIKAKLLSSELPGFNTGGFISPTLRANRGNIVPGTGNTDTVPAMLTPGEFVINKQATTDNLPLLHAINDGKVAGYREGGHVQEIISGSNQNRSVEYVVRGGGGQIIGTFQSKEEADQALKQYRKEIKDRAKKISGKRFSMMGGQRSMGIGMGMGAVGGALSMAPMIPGVAENAGLSGALSGAGMGVSMLSMLPMMGVGGPATLAIGAIAAAAAGTAFAIYKFRDAIDTASRQAAEFGANIGGTANALNKAAEIFGAQTPAQRQAAQAMGFTPEQQQQAVNQFSPFFGSEQGQKFIEDLKGATSQERFQKLSDYMKNAIASGMTDKASAQTFAKTVGSILGDPSLGAGVASAIAKQETGSKAMLSLARGRESAVAQKVGALKGDSVGFTQAAKVIGSSGQVIQDFANAAALAKEDFAAGDTTYAEYTAVIEESRNMQIKYTDSINDALNKTNDFGATMQAVKKSLVDSGLATEEQTAALEEAAKTTFAQKKQKGTLSMSEIAQQNARNAAGARIGMGAAYVSAGRYGGMVGGVKTLDKDLFAAAQAAVFGGMDINYATELTKVIGKGKGPAAKAYTDLVGQVGATEAFGTAGLVRSINKGQIAGLEGNRQAMDLAVNFVQQGGTSQELLTFLSSLPEEKRINIVSAFDDMDQGRRERWIIDYNKIQGMLGPDLSSDILLSAEYKEANAKGKDSIINGIELFDKLPPSIDKTVAYDLAMTKNGNKPLTLKESQAFVKSINQGFTDLQSTDESIVKKISLDMLNTMGVDTKNAIAYMDEIQKKIKDFEKLPAEQKFEVLTAFSVLGEAEQAVANYLQATKNGGFDYTTYMGLVNAASTARSEADQAIAEANVAPTTEKKTGGGGGGQKSLSEQLSDQLKEIRKLYAALGKVINPKTMKAVIAGPFAPEFLQYLADQGEEGRKILEGNRKKLVEEYKKFKEIKFTELAIASKMAPGMRREQLARQRGQTRFTTGLISQGLNQEQVDFVGEQISADTIRARDVLLKKKKEGTITDSERQQLRDYNNDIKNAIASSKEFSNISLQDKINSINLEFKETNADLNKTLELMASGIPPEFASELAQVDGASEMSAAQLAVLASQMMEVKTKTEIAKGALVNFSEELDIVGQTTQTQIEAINKLEIEPIQNQIDDLNDSITALEKKKKPHQDAIEALREEEEQLQKVYDDRMKALDEVEAQNRRIADQQRGQMDVASALSRGDIAGAAQAALELQRTMAQQRAEEAKNAVQQQFENERAVIAEKIKAEENAIKAIDDQILGVQDAIAAKQKEIEAAKERQLVLEQKLYAIQLMRDMIETKRAQQEAALNPARQDEAALYGSLLQTQGGLFAGLPFAKTPEGQALFAQFNQGQGPVLPGMPGATLGGMSASASPGTQFNEMMKKELPKVEEAIKAMTGEKGLPTLMGSFVNGLVDSVNQFLSYVANALNATPIVIPPIEIPWTATYNAGKGKTGVVSGVAKTAKTTTNIQKLSSIVLEGQKKAFGGMIAYKGSTEKAPGMMMGGKVKKYAFGSFVPGQGATDKVPAMLTPGEFIVRKPVAQEFRSQLEALNSQVYPSIPTRYRENGIDSLVNIGSAPSFNPLSNYSDASRSIIDTSSFNYDTFPVVNNDMSAVTPYVTNLSNNTNSVSNFSPVQYNYNVSVNAKTNANPDEIANAVTRKISQRQDRMIRGTKING